MIEGVPSGFEIRSVYDAQGLADACVSGQKLQEGERVVCAIIRPVGSVEVSQALQEKLQKLMYYLTKEAARTSYREFLEFLDINEDEYLQIKSIWKEKLGVKPYV